MERDIGAQRLDILVVAPHPDDAELGMGGAIAQFIEQGLRVGILDLTSGEPTPHGSPEIRRQETKMASRALGVTWRQNLGLSNRRLEPSFEARARLAEVFRETRAATIFAPYWIDAHPDHVAATELVEAARFWAKLTKTGMRHEPFHPARIYNYYCVHLKMHPQPAFVMDISSVWEKKKASIAAYQSQFVIGRENVVPGFLEQIEMEAQYWGKTIGVRYGEPFAAREPIGMRDFRSLI